MKSAKVDFDQIAIIYNPNSTGNSKAMAKRLQRHLKRSKLAAELIATKHAGHAEEIARKISTRHKNPLIISSSGDGGYNEVVNGVMSAKRKAVCAVLPAGNANDHSQTMRRKPLHKLIVKNQPKKIDLIKVTVWSGKKKPVIKYAHSYAGLGLTSVIASDLNKHKLNLLYTTYLVLKNLVAYEPIKIIHDNEIVYLNTLVFGNINRMAKFARLAEENRPADGLFEIVLLPPAKRRETLKSVVKAIARQHEKPTRAKKYEFQTIQNVLMQFDGEVLMVPRGSRVEVASAHNALTTII